MNPIEIILVTSGTNGERLLFRYPFESNEEDNQFSKTVNRNPYAIKVPEVFQHQKYGDNKTAVTDKYRCSSSILVHLLAAKSSLCLQNFDLKINDIRFIGFPVVLHTTLPKQTGHHIITVNVVFTLKANVDNFIKERYHIISKQITIGIQHEERRCNYLSVQAKIMMALQDETAARTDDFTEPPYKLILLKSQLANELKQIYDSLCSSGVIQMYLNNWVEINFCLPTIYSDILSSSSHKYDYDTIENCLSKIRPYHGLLLKVDEQVLLDSLPMDSTPALTRLVKVTSPLKNIQTIALDADLSLSQVFQLVCHLIYWAKAVIIYPLCEINTYLILPHANLYVNSPLVQMFVDEFPGKNLHVELAEFSLPKQLQEGYIFEHKYQQTQRVKMVIWFLQHQLLIQLHKFISIVPQTPPIDEQERKDPGNEDDLLSVLLEDTNLTKTHSLSDLASVNSDESYGQSTANLLSKSPSLDLISTEDSKLQWASYESVMTEMKPKVRIAIKNLPAARNIEDLNLFLRLSPYFNGKCHLEEIMFYENLTRSQITTLLDKFKDILVLCFHVDPVTTFFT